MEKFVLAICLAFVLIKAVVIPKETMSSIYGTIEPADVAKKVWAINGKDSVSVVPESGKFSIAVTPGNWRIVVEAAKPYKDAVLDNIKVEEGKSTDAGIIKLASE